MASILDPHRNPVVANGPASIEVQEWRETIALAILQSGLNRRECDYRLNNPPDEREKACRFAFQWADTFITISTETFRGVLE